MENNSNQYELISELFTNELEIDGEASLLAFQTAVSNVSSRHYALFRMLLSEIQSKILKILKDDLEIEQIKIIFKEMLGMCDIKIKGISGDMKDIFKISKANIDNLNTMSSEIKNILENTYNIKIKINDIK